MAFVLLQDGSFFYLLMGETYIGRAEPAWMIYPLRTRSRSEKNAAAHRAAEYAAQEPAFFNGPSWTYHPCRLHEAGRFPLTEDEKRLP